MNEEMQTEEPKNSEAVQTLRTNLRTNLKISRDSKRHGQIDSIRIGIGEIGEHIANVNVYKESDVLDLAARIKHQKHAKPDDLNVLSHAFLQTEKNIKCFLSITGALNVLIKELTGQFWLF